MKTYGGNRRIAPPIHILNTRWKPVFNFSPRSLYPCK